MSSRTRFKNVVTRRESGPTLLPTKYNATTTDQQLEDPSLRRKVPPRGGLTGKDLAKQLLELSNFNSSDKKMERLRNIDLFILDNSVRETTVAQTRGHTMEDKYKILNMVSGAGFENVIIGTFGTRPKIDDLFAKDCCGSGKHAESAKYCNLYLYCFAEVRDLVIDGIPLAMTPVGIKRAQEYRIANVVIEADLLCPLTNWEEYGIVRYCELLHQRIDQIRCSCKSPYQNEPNRIFVNIRDFAAAWEAEPDRIVTVLSYLARMRETERIMGICFEDPTGGVFPWILGDDVRRTRNLFDLCGWKDGHILCHVHQAYGLAEAAVLECLMGGATGIWCGIPREGAAAGHANSLTTVVNLARAGNQHVRKRYNIARLRRVAIDMTKIITGEAPHPMTELYGSRALDICFDPAMGMSGPKEQELLKEFQIPRRTRISTMCTDSMFVDALDEHFGEADSWPDDIGSRMYAIIHSDLEANRKEEYNSIVGLASLYERSGEKLTRAMRKVIAADTEMEESPLVVKLHNYCLEWRSCRRANEKQITYIQFYDGFLAKYVGCFSCPLTRNAFEILDLDNNGFISWDELGFRAKWCIKEFPDLCTDIESSIRVLFEKYLIPEITSSLQLKFFQEGQQQQQQDHDNLCSEKLMLEEAKSEISSSDKVEQGSFQMRVRQEEKDSSFHSGKESSSLTVILF
jgi:hypothetical protein